jgi:hypothetical protein
VNVFEWIAAQERVLRARQGLLDVAVRYQRAVVDLEAATGVPLAAAPKDQP